MDFKKMTSDDEVFSTIRAHLNQFWPDRPHEEFVWTKGPINQKFPHFRVRRIKPVKEPDAWIYATVGAWEATAEDQHGTEFVLLAPEENPLHVELLAMVTNLHADPRYRLQVGSTINIGRPWVEGSLADHLLVSLPYPYGPEFEICNIGDEHIRFLWLVPITSSEASLVRSQGLEALERLLEQGKVNTVNPQRRSVI